jgi:hypothetical protein
MWKESVVNYVNLKILSKCAIGENEKNHEKNMSLYSQSSDSAQNQGLTSTYQRIFSGDDN